MIFITVGTHTQQFDRLLKEVDILVQNKKIKDVFAQTGNSCYIPGYPHKKFLSDREYVERFGACDTVISHAGAGTIIRALSLRKRLIIVPRLKRFGEHANDHQLDLARELQKNGICECVSDVVDLGKTIKKPGRKYLKQKNTQLVNEINNFLTEVETCR